MAILFKKAQKLQTGGVAEGQAQQAANYWRQQMSDLYGKHLGYLKDTNATMDRVSPYFEKLQANPLYMERQASTRGPGMPGGWEYDMQSFKPGYFDKHYGEDYFKQMTDSDPERLQSAYKQYGTPIPVQQ